MSLPKITIEKKIKNKPKIGSKLFFFLSKLNIFKYAIILPDKNSHNLVIRM